MEPSPTVDDLLVRWQALRETNAGATIEDIYADCPELAAQVKERLHAVASMMSFLRLGPDSGAVGSLPTGSPAPVGSAMTIDALTSRPTRDSADSAQCVHVPGYEIMGELGRGGMGVVYLARQQSLNRVVALKMILGASHAGSREAARFTHEAKTIALLKHPHVVQVYECGSHDGVPFFSLEYLEGGSLADKLRGEPQAPRQAAKLTQVLAQAVQAAHEQGIVHRDLKPANVLLTADGTAKISDFGVAKQSDSVMTATGEVLGTPSYMAPEQASGKTKDVGPAADLYALGAILYELLTGRPPFKGASAWETIQLVCHSDPVAAPPVAAETAARSGNDLSEMPGERPRQALCHGSRPCRRPGALPVRRVDSRPAGRGSGTRRSLVPPKYRGGRLAGRGRAHAGSRHCHLGVLRVSRRPGPSG